MVNTKLVDHFRSPETTTAITNVEFNQERIFVYLTDGRIISTPLSWFPVLETADSSQRMEFRISGEGIHWDNLDEDISLETFLANYK